MRRRGQAFPCPSCGGDTCVIEQHFVTRYPSNSLMRKVVRARSAVR